jgi:hypothetical protein
MEALCLTAQSTLCGRKHNFKDASRHTTCKISWGPFAGTTLARKKPMPDPAVRTPGASALAT